MSKKNGVIRMNEDKSLTILSGTAGLGQSVELLLSNLYAVAQNYFDSKNYPESVAYLRLILQDSPNHLSACSLMAKALVAQEKYEEALPYIENCIQIEPQTVDFWDFYIQLLERFGNLDILAEARALKVKVLAGHDAVIAVEETPATASHKLAALVSNENKNSNKNKNKNKKKASVEEKEKQIFKMLVLLYEQNKWVELEKYARQNIEQNLCAGFAWRFLGVIYMENGQLELAEKAMLNSLFELPGDVTSNFNYGLLCAAKGEYDSAEQQYRRVILLDPKFFPAYNNLGNILRSKGEFDEAETCFRKLIRMAPNLDIACFNLVNVLVQKRSLLDALKECRQAVDRFPMSADLQNALGSIYFLLHQHEDAIAPLTRAIELNPKYGDAYNNLGCVYFDKKNYAKARPYLLMALDHSSGAGSTYRCLGQIARELDRDYEKAIELTRKALEIDPDDSVAHNSLLYMLSEFEDVTPEELFLEHQLYGSRAEIRWRVKQLPHLNTKERDRCLRVGFVSGDFYKHAVASFFEPILAAMAKSDNVHLFAYYSNDIEDDVTKRIKSYTKGWRQIQDLDDDEVSCLVRDDQIDILIDLSGHTSNNRLQLFARKPAPIAVTWIGYPGTTGLSTIDYFIADRFYIPHGEFDHLFTEKLAYIPCASTFQMESGAPEVGPLPALSRHYLTFGSFNRISKITEGTVRAWASLMSRLADSRILIGGMHNEYDLSTFSMMFEKFGIARERIDFFGRMSMHDYLALHNRVDICLDTFPYNGGTTIHHALSMGVPTLSIKGSKIPARSSAAILGQVGLDSFLAEDVDDFVAKGIFWSHNLESLAKIRASLRKVCADSIKSKPDLLAIYLNRALRQMWEKWCDGEPASTFSVEEE